MWAVVGPGEGTKYATCGDVAWHASRPLKTCLLPASIWTGKRGETRTREGGEIEEEGRRGREGGREGREAGKELRFELGVESGGYTTCQRVRSLKMVRDVGPIFEIFATK